jgi:formate hydrogenlyase subunit 3/multisubunit Na+/H+ antiporter MnhD subunit
MTPLAGTAQEFGPGLLVAALAAPLAVLVAFLSPRMRNLALAMAPIAPLPAVGAGVLAAVDGRFGAELPAVRASLWLDRPGAILLVAAALIWLIGSVFVLTDRAGRPNADRFALSWLLTMAGSLGVFIVADLLTFYLVYALVSVPAYYLVAHDDDDSGSSRAGGVYMAFALLGEAVLLIAFVMLAAGEPSGSLDIRAVIAALPASPWRDAVLALLIIGFGMKIGLAPGHGWMPLAYTAAPIPAAAVLSGAAVNAGVIGLIRFLPFGAALPGWGEALAWAGFVSAFYGVAIGLTQKNPKTVLAYSSISQMGVIAAALGMGLASADQGAASDVAFYAVNHALVKAALFMTIGAFVMLGERRLSPALIVAGLLGLSLGGLPLTGGALAKLAVKGPFSDGAAKWAAAASAAASTALMLHFALSLARTPRSERASTPRGRVSSWLALAALSILVPWLMFPAIGGDFAEAFSAAKLWDAIWPMLIGAALAIGFWALGEPAPRIPAGDIVVAEEAAFRAMAPLGALVERIDWTFRQWPAAGLSLLTIALILAAAGFAGR